MRCLWRFGKLLLLVFEAGPYCIAMILAGMDLGRIDIGSVRQNQPLDFPKLLRCISRPSIQMGASFLIIGPVHLNVVP